VCRRSHDRGCDGHGAGIVARPPPGPSCMAWHGMLPHFSLSPTHAHQHSHLLSPLSSFPVSSLHRSHVASLFLLVALPCPALSCTSLSLGSQPLPLELVGDFPPTISCPRAAPTLAGPRPHHLALLHVIVACILFSLFKLYHRITLGSGGRYHHTATLIHLGQLSNNSSGRA